MPVFVDVIAPSRLHFGLLSFAQPGTRQYGGAGVMVNQPGLRLRVSPAERFECAGPLAERARAVVERYAGLLEMSSLPPCRVEILAAPEEHIGLGTGTQLALSVVQAVHTFRGGERLLPSVLATRAGRGARSAVGTYGFMYGGLVVEAGKFGKQRLAPLEQRFEVPNQWRFVLIRLHGQHGLSGEAERGAFEGLPAVPRTTTAALLEELSSDLLPALKAGEFERFAESLYRYGHTAGMCFAPRQSGAFASPRLAELVATVRELGVRGVGQSSWGPTVFAVLDSPARAEKVVERLRAQLDQQDIITIAEPNNTGAQIITHNDP